MISISKNLYEYCLTIKHAGYKSAKPISFNSYICTNVAREERERAEDTHIYILLSNCEM